MKVLLVHNYYQQQGGEDRVFEAESALLRAKGHNVQVYTEHNDVAKRMSHINMATAAIWSRTHYDRLMSLVQDFRPNVVHVHNTFPLISPAVYYAADRVGAAVVQTIHNFRLTCVNGLLSRNGQVCEDCLGLTVPWWGAIRGCYRDSRIASTVAAGTIGLHKVFGTYSRRVDAYIALTSFSRGKLVRAGLPQERIFVKPNFLPDIPEAGKGEGGYALFVGRLVEEKGIRTLLKAWESNKGIIPLRVVGQGPLADLVERTVATTAGVTWLGTLDTRDVLQQMKDASILVFPSEWYEGLPMTIVEAFAVGTPVVASRLGSMKEVVDDKRTGLLFEAGDSIDLADKVLSAVKSSARLVKMRQEARREFEAKYTAEQSYAQMMNIYSQAQSLKRSRLTD